MRQLVFLTVIYLLLCHSLYIIMIKDFQLDSDLNDRIQSILSSCGEICNTNIIGNMSKYYPFIEKKFSCRPLFSNPDIDKKSQFLQPPKKIPMFLRNLGYFDYHGKLKIQHSKYFDDNENGRNITWTLKEIQIIREDWINGVMDVGYSNYDVINTFNHITNHLKVQGQHVLVIGSQTPWLEVLLLEAGAAQVTTLEYNNIISHHPKLTPMTPATMTKLYLEGKLPKYDAMATFSSLEHSGLGRYGDQLNPWGDLITMARVHCMLKDGAKALVGVPTGPDMIEFNEARLYGQVLYSHLFANWKVLYTDSVPASLDPECRCCYQPLHVIQKV